MAQHANTFVLADVVGSVDVEGAIRVDRDTHLTDVRVEFPSIKPTSRGEEQ